MELSVIVMVYRALLGTILGTRPKNGYDVPRLSCQVLEANIMEVRGTDTIFERFSSLCKRNLTFSRFWFLAAGLLVPSLVFAGPNDIRLSGLAQGFTPQPNAQNQRPLAQSREFQARFAALSYQLGILMLPNTLTPAETLGFDGFVVQAETSFGTIDTETGDAENYWVLGTEESAPSSVIPSATIRVRKGLPYSLEIGAGLSTIFGSRLSAIQGDFKWSLLEGFQRWYFLPDVSFHAGVSRLLGAPDLDLTSVTAGGMLSKSIGIRGNFSLTPYFSYEKLFVIALSQVVDFTPTVSATTVPEDLANNDVFAECDSEGSRISGGVRVVYTKAVFTASLAVTPENDIPVFEAWDDFADIFDKSDDGGGSTVSEFIGGPVKGQKSFQLGVGFDF
jgi:hypothetical protein